MSLYGTEVFLNSSGDTFDVPKGIICCGFRCIWIFQDTFAQTSRYGSTTSLIYSKYTSCDWIKLK